MGTSLALIGAYVLAGELSQAGEGELPRQAFSRYERAFRPFVEETQKILPIFPGIAHPKTAWQRWVFQIGIAGIARVVNS
jgi:2-polyprenyl-6-methoxyphenol hydroxylase-like FAD-dependent oxidoreductase